MSKKIIITASVFNLDTEEESHGWVDLNWNRFELREDSEDVSTHEVPDDHTVEEFVESLIGPVHITGGMHYAEDPVINGAEHWSYAACIKDF